MAKSVESIPSEIMDDDGVVILHAKQLRALKNQHEDFVELPVEDETQEVSKTERIVLSFNHHPVFETTVASMTLAGIGFATGAAIFSRRQKAA